MLNDERELNPPRRPSRAIDRKAYAAEIDMNLPALRQALKDVANEAREAETTQATKNRAMADYNLSFVRGANLLEALFSFASLDELAAKVRPSRRRPGRTAESVDAQESAPQS